MLESFLLYEVVAIKAYLDSKRFLYSKEAFKRKMDLLPTISLTSDMLDTFQENISPLQWEYQSTYIYIFQNSTRHQRERKLMNDEDRTGSSLGIPRERGRARCGGS